MGLEVSLVNGAAKTTTGIQDYVGSLNGATPAVSLFALCPGIGGGGFSGHYVSFGASDNANSLFLNSYAVDNEATTTTRRGQDLGVKASVPVLHCKNDGVEEVYSAKVSSFSADKVTLDWTAAPATAHPLSALLMGGSGVVNVAMGTITAANSGSTSAKTGLGFEPNCILFYTSGITNQVTSESPLVMSWGVAVNNEGVIEQGAYSKFSQNNITTAQTSAVVWDNRIASQQVDNTINWSNSVQSFDADGFTLAGHNGGASGDDINYVALELNARIAVKHFGSPTNTDLPSLPATRDDVIGFEAQAAMIFTTKLAAANTLYNSSSNPEQAALGITDGANSACHFMAMDDQVVTSNFFTKSYTDRLIYTQNLGGSIQYWGEHNAFGATTHTVNWLDLGNSSWKYFGLYIGVGSEAIEQAVALVTGHGAQSDAHVGLETVIALAKSNGLEAGGGLRTDVTLSLVSQLGVVPLGGLIANGHLAFSLNHILDTASQALIEANTGLAQSLAATAVGGSLFEFAFGLGSIHSVEATRSLDLTHLMNLGLATGTTGLVSQIAEVEITAGASAAVQPLVGLSFEDQVVIAESLGYAAAAALTSPGNLIEVVVGDNTIAVQATGQTLIIDSK